MQDSTQGQMHNGGVGGPRTAAGVAQQYAVQQQRQMQYQQQQQQQLQQQQQRLDPRSRLPNPFPTSHLPTAPPPPSKPGLMDYSYRGDVFDRITKRSLAINRFAHNHDLLEGIFDRWSVEDILDGSKRRREEGVEATGKRRFVEGGFLGVGLREERELRGAEWLKKEKKEQQEEQEQKEKLAAKNEEIEEGKPSKGEESTQGDAPVPNQVLSLKTAEQITNIEESSPTIPKRKDFLLAMRDQLLKETAEAEQKYADMLASISSAQRVVVE